MNTRIARLLACTLATTALPALAAIPTMAVAASTAYQPPLNAWGQPQLSGTWSNETLTRMTRPAKYGGRLVMTPDEVATAEGARAQLIANGNKPTDPGATVEDVQKKCDIPGAPVGTTDCGYNVGWVDASQRVMRVNGEPRTSLITFPATGQIPYLPGKGKFKSAWGVGNTDNPENRGLPDRCLVGQNISTGAILNPTLYNNTYVIQQSPDTVAIIVEMSHDARLIRLNARKHDPEPKWFGDSIGHYEANTLVVETTNFHPEQLARNSDKLKITERFTRIAPDRILYQFKVEDPETYSQPWGGEYEFHTSSGPQYEYACHEGNYGLLDILKGAREEEKTQAAAQSGKTASAGGSN